MKNDTPITKEEFKELVNVTESGCWEWKLSRNENRKGYGQKRIGGRKEGRVISSHRLAWWVFHGYEPKGKFICHHCDNPPCCNPDHLFLGNAKINHLDMCLKGREYVPETARGEDSHWAKLTENEVIDIKKALLKGEKLSALARQYMVTRQAIWRIKEGKAWGWLMIQ